jgi:hypothetical protein
MAMVNLQTTSSPPPTVTVTASAARSTVEAPVHVSAARRHPGTGAGVRR